MLRFVGDRDPKKFTKNPRRFVGAKSPGKFEKKNPEMLDSSFSSLTNLTLYKLVPYHWALAQVPSWKRVVPEA